MAFPNLPFFLMKKSSALRRAPGAWPCDSSALTAASHEASDVTPMSELYNDREQ